MVFSYYLCPSYSSKVNQLGDENSDGKELISLSSTFNHFLGICNNLLLLFEDCVPSLQLSITPISTSLSSHSFMATHNMLSDAETKVFIPSPLWWHPSARWIAISHLPIHLHNHAILASLVAHFGTFISFSYPANLPDKKVVMVLVGNCFITKIPHILPVKEGERVFPVRIQVVFQTKISGEGIIFDPYDLGDDFCSFFSGGQVPPPPQQGSTFPVVPAFLSHTRDKKNASFKAKDNTSKFKIGTLLIPLVSHQDVGNMLPPARASGSNWANIGQTLAPAINKFVSEVNTLSSDSDTSYHVKSHHTCSEVSLPLDTRVSQSRKRNLVDEETASWSHLLELCSKTLKPSYVKVDQKIPDTNLKLQPLGQHGKTDNSTGTAVKQPADFSLSPHELKHDSGSHNISLVKEPAEGVIQLKVKEAPSRKKETTPELLANPPLVFRRKKTRQLEADWKLKQPKQWDELKQGEDIGTQPHHARQKEVTEDELQKDLHLKKVACNLGKHIEKA